MQPPSGLFDDHNSEHDATPSAETIQGFRIWRGAVQAEAQQALVSAVRGIIAEAPLVRRSAMLLVDIVFPQRNAYFPSTVRAVHKIFGAG